MEDCIFCKIIKGEIPAHKINENEEVIVFLSLQGHPLVVTKKHIENIYQLDDESASAVMMEAVKIAKAVKKGLGADGVNLVQNNESAGGQEVFHFHIHIKPRWHQDNVKLYFPEDPKANKDNSSTLDKIKSAL